MRLTWHATELELAEPLRISRSVMARRDAVWVAIEHGGLTGWGEVVSSDYLGLPTPRIVRHLTTARPAVERLPDPETAWHAHMAVALPGLSELPAGVLAGVEAALLDLVGKRAAGPPTNCWVRTPHRPHRRPEPSASSRPYRRQRRPRASP